MLRDRQIAGTIASSFPEGDNPQRVSLENICFTCFKKVLACFRVSEISVVQAVSSYKMLGQVHTSATVCIPTTQRKPPKVLKSVTTEAATNQLWPQFRKNSQLKADIATG